MNKAILLLLLLTTVVLNAQDNQRRINVTGTAQMYVDSDFIDIAITVENIGADLETCKSAHDSAFAHVQQIINKYNIAKEDYSVSPVTFSKVYDFQKYEYRGYKTIAYYKVKLRKIDKYFLLVSDLSKNNLVSITRSEQGLDKKKELMEELMKKALLNGKKRAELMASTLNSKLGKVILIDENSGVSNSYMKNNFADVQMLEETNLPDLQKKILLSKSIDLSFGLVD